MIAEPIKVFFSYSHRDEEFKDELVKHLSVLQRQGVISGWHDRMIQPGSDWDREIDASLSSADIILLMVSADFLASEYCWGVEVQKAMQRHEAGEACVIPIILRYVDWEETPIAKLQALPKNAEPIASWVDRDQAFTNVAKGIRVIANAIQERRQRTRQTPTVSAPSAEESAAAPVQITAQDFFKSALEKQNKGDNPGAIADYTTAINLKPSSSDAYNNRGNVRAASGDNQGAIADYTTAIELNDDWGNFTSHYYGLPTAYSNRGLARAALGDNQSAIADCTKAINLKPDYVDAYHHRGDVHAALGNNREAIADYTKAINLKPDYVDVYNNRANVHAALGNNREAIADYTQAIHLKPDCATPYYGRGVARFDLGNDQEAIADYNQAIRLKPDYAEPYYGRGWIRKEQGDKSHAIADFQKAADLYQQQGNSEWHQNALDQLKELQS
jgi:tetratricopeptide (TPR) repeat protein